MFLKILTSSAQLYTVDSLSTDRYCKRCVLQIIYFEPLILPLYISFEITRSIHAKKNIKGLFRIFFDFYRTELR